LAWLPVDNLELALAHAPSAGGPLVDGIAAIRSQAIDTLARLGYPRIDAENVPFDPRIHEVVSVSETDEVPPGTVLTVMRPGYGGTDTILRPAAVVVSRQTPDRQGSPPVLGVRARRSPTQSSAYRKLRKYHPDVNRSRRRQIQGDR
jgi:hypothetical protein